MVSRGDYPTLLRMIREGLPPMPIDLDERRVLARSFLHEFFNNAEYVRVQREILGGSERLSGGNGANGFGPFGVNAGTGAFSSPSKAARTGSSQGFVSPNKK